MIDVDLIAFDNNKNRFDKREFTVDFFVRTNASGYKQYGASNIDTSIFDMKNPYRFLWYKSYEYELDGVTDFEYEIFELGNIASMSLGTSKHITYYMIGEFYEGTDLAYYSVNIDFSHNTLTMTCRKKDGSFLNITNKENGADAGTGYFIASY